MIENFPKIIVLLILVALTWTMLLVRQNGHNPVLQPDSGYYREDVHKTPTTRTQTEAPTTPCKMQTIKRKAVIIFTTTRSGSTFLGEFFNRHSEIYYLFEPLHGISYVKNQTLTRQTIIRDLLKCNYSQIPDAYRNNSNDKWIKCKSNICFQDRMELLWRNTDLCVGKKPYCGVKVFDPKILEKICRQSLFTVVKTVGIPNLSELEPILLDSELDLKVIQLVRDPRAVVPSTLAMNNVSSERTRDVSTKVCQFFSRNANYTKRCILPSTSRQNVSFSCSDKVRKAWSRNFMRISHEYLSIFPFEALQAVYNFVGINYDSSVVKWMEENTGVKTIRPKRGRRSVLPSNFYTTQRNSTAIVNAWRLKQNFSTVSLIERYCQSTMKDLGYFSAKSSQDLKNVSKGLFDLKQTLILN